jgi:pilus assembly protein CpaE
MRGTAAGFLWVTDETGANRELIESAGREFGMKPRFCRPAEVLDVIRSARVDLVGIELPAESRVSLALLRELHERLPRVTILAASADPGVTLIRAALDAGATDVLSLPLGRGELHKALIKFSQTEVRNAAGRGVGGSVIAVYGARGGLGASTLAVNLATRLMALAGTDTAIVDMDLQRGDVGAFLNLTPSQSIAAIVSARGEVDDLFLHGTLTRHSSGLFVLPAPPEMEEGDSITDADVEVVFRLLRAQFRWTVVDTPRTLHGAVVAALEQSDRTIVLTDLAVPSVRAAKRTFELLGRLGVPMEHLELVVTEAIAGPLDVKDVVRALGRTPLVVIPRDAEGAGRAMNSGTPIAGGGIVSAIDELAAKLTGIRVAQRPKGGGALFRRIFAAKEAPAS